MTETDDRGSHAAGNFLVEIDGVQIATFTKCYGLGSETDVVEYRGGGDPLVRKVAGLTRYGNIVLETGCSESTALWEWRHGILNGKADRRNGAIVLLDESRAEVARWSFWGGWPAKWEGPVLDAASNEVAVERFEIAVERIERV